MAKQAYVYSGTDWVPLASEVTNLSNYQLSNGVGLNAIIPTSVSVGSGSASISTAGQVSFTGASSVSLNDVFSATYDNYRILLRLTAASADLNVNFRFRVSGADNSTSNYSRVGWYVGSDSSSGASVSINQAQFGMGSMDTTTPTYHLHDILVSLPFATDYTQFQKTSGTKNQTAIHFSEFDSYWFNATTSFTGFTVYPSTGNITGTVAVYGYKD
jgi:hypothetical protein